MQRGPRVLMALGLPAAQRMSRILEGYHIERAQTLGDLLQALEQSDFDIVIVGSNFGSLNALEALELVLAKGPSAPVVCVRAERFRPPLGRGTLEALRAASQVLGVKAFLDVASLPDDARGNAQARTSLEHLLARRRNRNVGRAEVKLRLIAALALLVAAFVVEVPNAWGVVAFFFGVAVLATALARYCPLNAIFDRRSVRDAGGMR